MYDFSTERALSIPRGGHNCYSRRRAGTRTRAQDFNRECTHRGRPTGRCARRGWPLRLRVTGETATAHVETLEAPEGRRGGALPERAAVLCVRRPPRASAT